jgi:hypothetical protein
MVVLFTLGFAAALRAGATTDLAGGVMVIALFDDALRNMMLCATAATGILTTTDAYRGVNGWSTI